MKGDTNTAFRKHRLHSLCPYLAMFPPDFAREQILRYTRVGEFVFDPFSGRGTTLLEALLNGRNAIAVDINPVAYCLTAAKANCPRLETVLSRLDELEKAWAAQRTSTCQRHLPEFFHWAFHKKTLSQLLFLRDILSWKRSRIDRFLTSLVLGHLHGELNRSQYYLSNQMPHSISTKPGYSVHYWRKRRLKAPFRETFSLLRNRALFRYSDGIPPINGKALLCDARYSALKLSDYRGQVKAVITSPPYLDVTRYEEDQWLRLWFLGGPPYPTYFRVSRDDRHRGKQSYWRFLFEVWRGITPLLHKKAMLVCRIGTTSMAVGEIVDGLSETVRGAWSKARLAEEPAVSRLKNRQIAVLHPRSIGCRQEVDCVFELRSF